MISIVRVITHWEFRAGDDNGDIPSELSLLDSVSFLVPSEGCVSIWSCSMQTMTSLCKHDLGWLALLK